MAYDNIKSRKKTGPLSLFLSLSISISISLEERAEKTNNLQKFSIRRWQCFQKPFQFLV